MAVAYPVSKAPFIEMVDPPALSSEGEQIIAQVRQEIEASPNLFDGPILFCQAVEDEKVICFPATYAWELAEDWPGRPEGIQGGEFGAVSTSLLITSGDQALWQKRGHWVMEPDSWYLSAAGTLRPGQTFRDTAYEELEEELGIYPSQLESLEPVALCYGQGIKGIELFYQARLVHGAQPRVDGSEAVDLQWAGLTNPPEPNSERLQIMLDAVLPCLESLV